MKLNKESVFVHFTSNLIILAVVSLLIAGVYFSEESATVSVNGKAIYKGDTKEPRVSLMINVYWGTEYIEPMLDVLDAYGVRTTFFIGGSWAAKNNELVKEIAARGHELGNHGYLHLDAGKLSLERNKQEIELTNKLIAELTGKTPSLFAPPSGDVGTNMYKACDALNMKVILWSRDTIDWRDKDADLVLKRATSDIQYGDLILMHPTAHTLAALPQILEYYKKAGIRAVCVSDNITSAN
jgi:peptidoglycan/xylan/chitin deacetylase (PgdA/CDA1 family)